MSQKKVESYKEEKKNRKKNLEKKKRQQKLWSILGPILALVIIAGVGCGIYFIPQLTSKAIEDNTADDVDMDALLNSINSSVSDNSADTAQ